MYFLFMDRGKKAGDNAEYFYRWMRENHPEIKISYLLQKISFDWDRLKKDNFNLVDINDTAELRKVISYCTHFCFSYYPIHVLGSRVDILDYSCKKIMLNHGVFMRPNSYIKNNRNYFDLMIAGNKLEYDVLLNPWHKLRKEQVALCGLPRVDSLIKKHEKNKGKEDSILIQFWWRPDTKRNEEKFLKSNFYINVSKLLKSDEWEKISKKYNVKFIFKLHVEMEHYRKFFPKNDYIEFIDNASPFEPLFLRSKMIITDFTSNVYEMGYINKPCIYYEPDWKDLDENFKKVNDGFSFDLEGEGLGPVVYNESDLFNQLIKLLENDLKLDDKYIKRRKEQLTFMMDPHNCERCFSEILKIKDSTKVTNWNSYSPTSELDENYSWKW